MTEPMSREAIQWYAANAIDGSVLRETARTALAYLDRLEAAERDCDDLRICHTNAVEALAQVAAIAEATANSCEGDAVEATRRLKKRAEAAENVLLFVGTVVSEARKYRARGEHLLTVYGAIGKSLIDLEAFDSFCESSETAKETSDG